MASPLRFGILGTARIARTVVPRIAATQCAEVVAVASRSETKAQQFAQEFGIERAFRSYEELLLCPDIDAVYIPLPPSMHCNWVLQAAETGKHVLCEKPLAMNVAEVDQMIASCQQNGVILLDGVMWYHTARAHRMVEIARSGSLGKLRQITSAFTFMGDHLAADNLRWNRQMGGGSLLDLGWYCVGATLLFMERMPVQVFASAAFRNDVDQRLNGLLWFDDGCMATLECGFTTVRRRWLEVAGTKAALLCDDFTRPWNPDEPGFRIIDGDGRVVQELAHHPPQEECMVAEFCRLIDRGLTDHRWLQMSRNTQTICNLLDMSAREERVVLIE